MIKGYGSLCHADMSHFSIQPHVDLTCMWLQCMPGSHAPSCLNTSRNTACATTETQSGLNYRATRGRSGNENAAQYGQKGRRPAAASDVNANFRVIE